MASLPLDRTLTAPENRSRRPSRALLRRARSSPEDDSHQLFSPQFMDDHGAHQYHVSATKDGCFDKDADEDLGEKIPSQSPSATTSSEDAMSSTTAGESQEDVRFGTAHSRDVEAGPEFTELKLEKSASSVKDPNLVSPAA